MTLGNNIEKATNHPFVGRNANTTAQRPQMAVNKLRRRNRSI